MILFGAKDTARLPKTRSNHQKKTETRTIARRSRFKYSIKPLGYEFCKKSSILADKTSKIFYGTHQLANIAHFVIVPANSFHHLHIAYGDYLSLSSVEQ